jgi:hypothetical protein
MPDEVAAFFDALEGRRAEEAPALDALFQRASGFSPKLWGTVVGYGAYDYTYASGRSGTSFATGFSARKAKLSIYIMPGYADFDEILARLGKHKMGKACLTINKLPDIDLQVLEELVQAGLRNLAKSWEIRA